MIVLKLKPEICVRCVRKTVSNTVQAYRCVINWLALNYADWINTGSISSLRMNTNSAAKTTTRGVFLTKIPQTVQVQVDEGVCEHGVQACALEWTRDTEGDSEEERERYSEKMCQCVLGDHDNMALKHRQTHTHTHTNTQKQDGDETDDPTDAAFWQDGGGRGGHAGPAGVPCGWGRGSACITDSHQQQRQPISTQAH